jgi:hypothetical protein
MIARPGARRWQAALLFGGLLTGGCQWPASNAQQLTPDGFVKDSPAGKDTQFVADNATGQNQNPAPDHRPPGDVSMTVTERPDHPGPILETPGKDATTVSYIPPMGTAQSPYSPIAAPSGPSAATLPTDTVRRTDATPTGRPVNLILSDTRSARDVEMTAKYDGDNKLEAVLARVQQLEQRLEQRDQAVKQSGVEVQTATEEVHRTRTQLASLRKELDETRATMHDHDREYREAMTQCVELLERLEKASTPPADTSDADRKPVN